MGMFDWVRAEHKKLSKFSGLDLQTKDTPEQVMRRYRILPSGQLEIQKVQYITYPVADDANLWELLNSFQEKPVGWERVNFTGSLNIYTALPQDNKFVEAKCTFDKGKLKEVDWL